MINLLPTDIIKLNKNADFQNMDKKIIQCSAVEPVFISLLQRRGLAQCYLLCAVKYLNTRKCKKYQIYSPEESGSCDSWSVCDDTCADAILIPHSHFLPLENNKSESSKIFSVWGCRHVHQYNIDSQSTLSLPRIKCRVEHTLIWISWFNH